MTKAETTVAHILDAAEGLFLERNYADVTMDRIARSASVTKGALYHHFAGKEALYAGMLRRDFAEKGGLFRHAAESTGTARARLRRLTAAFFALPDRKRDLIRLVRRDLNAFPDSVRSELVRAYQSALPEPVQRIVEDGIRSGELSPGDARLLAWSFVAIVEVTMGPHARRVFPDDDARLDHVLNLFFSGAAGFQPSPTTPPTTE
ncbi:MAG: TetR/AcrR family transcriptional regulator [Gemmatimonadota bacterium]|jgi:AcrR family transcriptional regulator|nr:TetR/AcrR family transcriptional regulator [Gemmatimonadota bacterium]MDP6803552.1 TetR/AcrR family transcriptional regulator [Gemmatimonadota bacterium]MDP7031928.1 TetR/AcrR family transcriptional regulator [Gemmatimonadota bacterium]